MTDKSWLERLFQRLYCAIKGHWWVRESLYVEHCPCCGKRRVRRD